MAIRTITVCDGCGCELSKASDMYHLNLKTEVFCETCAVDIKESLRKIAASKEGRTWDEILKI